MGHKLSQVGRWLARNALRHRRWLIAILIVYVIVRGLSYVDLAADIPWGWADHLKSWITENSSGRESGSTTIRNVGLVVGGFFALVLAWWRTRIAQREAQTAQQGLLNERYQGAAEMLGSDQLSARLGGIYALERLLEDDLQRYYPEVVRLSCAFVRRPKDDESAEIADRLREDVQAVLDLIGRRNSAVDAEMRRIIPDEPREMFSMRVGVFDLSGAVIRKAIVMVPNFTGVIFTNADMTGIISYQPIFTDAELNGARLTEAKIFKGNFTKADLSGSDLSGAQLPEANLTNAEFTEAKLANANLIETNLSGAVLQAADISGVQFSRDGERCATGLTQQQLDEAIADPDNPPVIVGVVDAETDLPLVWRD